MVDEADGGATLEVASAGVWSASKRLVPLAIGVLGRLLVPPPAAWSGVLDSEISGNRLRGAPPRPVAPPVVTRRPVIREEEEAEEEGGCFLAVCNREDDADVDDDDGVEDAVRLGVVGPVASGPRGVFVALVADAGVAAERAIRRTTLRSLRSRSLKEPASSDEYSTGGTEAAEAEVDERTFSVLSHCSRPATFRRDVVLPTALDAAFGDIGVYSDADRVCEGVARVRFVAAPVIVDVVVAPVTPVEGDPSAPSLEPRGGVRVAVVGEAKPAVFVPPIPVAGVAKSTWRTGVRSESTCKGATNFEGVARSDASPITSDDMGTGETHGAWCMSVSSLV